MTSRELYEKVRPHEVHYLLAQMNHDGLNVNISDIFSDMVKDAARCNNYNSDVYYDMCAIDDALKNYNPEESFDPIWIGFRKMGVDGTSYVLLRAEEDKSWPQMALSKNYFALYSLDVREKSDGLYNVVWSEYSV